MNTLCLLLLCLLSAQAKESWKKKRDAPLDDFPSMSSGAGGYFDGGMGTAFAGGNLQGTHSDHTSGADPVGFQAIKNFANGAMAAIEEYGPGNIPKISSPTGAVSVGGVRVPSPVYGAATGASAPAQQGPRGGSFDFMSSLGHLTSDGNINSGGVLGAQNLGPSGTNIDHIINNGDTSTPNVFNYMPHFGGRDYNNLPHILPPGGKSIQQLQEESDTQLRALIANAHERQHKALEKIERLKTQYGTGTIGFNGYSDMRFQIPERIDLGTHKARDLGTSIDVSKYQSPNGKLRLPVQNVHHYKTVGIKIPLPYPVRHEVAAPYPVPVPVPVPVRQPSTEYGPGPSVTLTAPQLPGKDYLSSLTTNYQSNNKYNMFRGTTNQIDYDDDDDDDDSDESYSVVPSRTVVPGTSSISGVPSTRLPLETSYNPSATGHVGELSAYRYPPMTNVQITQPNREYLPG